MKLSPPFLSRILVTTIAAAVLLPTLKPAEGAVIITPVGVGTATGSGAADFGGMFDSQPASIPTVGDTAEPFGAGYGFFGNVGRVGYIDFGASFANFTLEGTYLGLKQFGNPPTAVITYWWSDATDNVFDGTDVALATDIGLFTAAPPNSNQQWVQSWSGSVPVAKRYLLVQFDSGSEGNRLTEAVFVGTVPEPSTALGLAFAAGLIGARRRRR